jgi:hypothetical protein
MGSATEVEQGRKVCRVARRCQIWMPDTRRSRPYASVTRTSDQDFREQLQACEARSTRMSAAAMVASDLSDCLRLGDDDTE